MYRVSILDSGHEFTKKNLVTKFDSWGLYDDYVCKRCGVRAKRYGIAKSVMISESVNRSKAYNCPKATPIAIPNRIRITNCHAVGHAFENLIPNSVHDTVDPPDGYVNDRKGVWVMGVGEPVKVLNMEFEIVKRKRTI